MRCGLPVSAGFLVYGDTSYRINCGWCFLVWSFLRHTEAITASGVVSRTYETHWFSGLLPKNGHSIWCISRTWFTVFEELTRLNDCSVFRYLQVITNPAPVENFTAFSCDRHNFRSYCFFIWTLSFICSRFGYILPAYPTLILRRQEQKQRDKLKPIPSVIFKDFYVYIESANTMHKIIFKNYGWYRLKFSKRFYSIFTQIFHLQA